MAWSGWPVIGKYALQFAEYAFAQRFAALPPKPAPVEPTPVAPLAPDVPVTPPPPKPDYERMAKDIYYDELRRMPDATEVYEAVLLLEQGREAKLRAGLKERAGT